MKWVVAIAGTLVALVLALAAVGLLQPREYVASITVRIAAPDSAVWAALTAFERMPEWYGEIRSVERIPDIDGRPAYNERHASGWVMTTVVRERIEEDRLVREFLPSGTFFGIWTFDLAPDAGGTRLTLTEHGHVDNPLSRALSMFHDNRKTIRTYVAALGRRLDVAVKEVP